MTSLAVQINATTLTDEDFLDRIGQAIEKAQHLHEGPYGLFDYTNYGDPIPHHVRDFIWPPTRPEYGKAVFKSTDPDQARSMYERLTRIYIARAALAAIDKEMVLA